MRIREPKSRAKPWSKTFQPDAGENTRTFLRGYPHACCSATATWWFYAADAISCARLPRTIRVLDARAPSRRPVDAGGRCAGLPATPLRPSDAAAATDGWRDGLREMLLRRARADQEGWLRRDCCERKDCPVSGCHGQTRRNRQEQFFMLFFCGSGSNFFYLIVSFSLFQQKK